MKTKKPLAVGLALGLMAGLAAGVPAVADQTVPEPGVPVANVATTRGTGVVTPARSTRLTQKTIDGNITDWRGGASGFGGTIVRSRGELVYQDHLFDAYGADDGVDAERLATLDPLAEALPETYRIDQIVQQDAPGEFGIPAGPLSGSDHYGDASGGMAGAADLLEVRVAPGYKRLWLLARTTTMTPDRQTAVLVLVDSGGEPVERTVPFSSGLTTEVGDVAFLLAGTRGWRADLATGAVTALGSGLVATRDAGWTNALEAALPAKYIERDGRARIAVATGTLAGDAELADLGVGARVANVAFRTDEPVRTWFEKRQALALYDGTVDPFLLDVDLTALRRGATETWAPGPGYHDRIFTSSEQISGESGAEGIHQHYGVYLPAAYRAGTASPLQWWLHWRGGKAHTAGAVIPGMFRDLGETRDAIVVSPRGRGSSSWYVGRGHVDVLEVWDDAFKTFTVDRDRVYLTGHSMGGWGSWLLSVLYPDRFAAALPVAGPVTQGAWTGADFPGCDEFQSDEYTPCYISANDGRPRDQHTRRMLENLRNVGVGIFQGAEDELVPVSGVSRQAEELARLGYRYRYYLFPAHEHYSHPVVDEWAEGARYFDTFVRDPNPAHVTYRRDMPFERAVEEVQATGLGLNFDFDSAYWMSELTPADPNAGVARFDGQSLAIPTAQTVTIPEAGGPASLGQTGPYAMSGLAWLSSPLGPPPAANRFVATLIGASAVRLDVARMRLDTGQTLVGSVSTDVPITLRLAGTWLAPPAVTIDGTAVAATFDSGVLSIPLPAGPHEVAIG